MLDNRKRLRFGKIGADLVREAETSLQAEEVQLCTPLVRRLGSNETRVGNLRLVLVESVAFLPRMGSPGSLLDMHVSLSLLPKASTFVGKISNNL
jgi:hypothetical protein